MYKALIVDDEITVCKGLSVLIDWEQYGYEAADYALRGVDALQKAESQVYDVVITDIRMPGMDGIELIKRLKEIKYPARVIILSAYRDFEYAKAAVEYGVKNYLLKPVDEKSLLDLVLKINVEIDEELKKQMLISESNRLLREKTLVDIVKIGANNSVNSKKADELDIYMKYPFFQVCIVEMEKIDDYISENERTIVKNITGELLELEQMQGYVLDLDETRIGIILCGYEELKKKSGFIMKKLFESIRLSTGYNITLSIGNEVDDSCLIYVSYKNAKKALDLKFFKGTNAVIQFDEIETRNFNNKSTFNWNFDSLICSVKENDIEKITLEIDKFFSEVYSKLWPVSIAYSIIINVYIRIEDCICDIGGFMPEFLNNKPFLEDIQRNRTLEELKDSLKEFCLKVSQYLKDAHPKSSNKLVDAVIKYVQEHCAENLTLVNISKSFFFNSVYLGRVFKNIKGMNFIDFMNHCRTEMAVKLLENTDLMVHEICEKVGYKDKGYFYRMFKKIKGISPSDYRAVHKK